MPIAQKNPLLLYCFPSSIKDNKTLLAVEIHSVDQDA